MSPGETVTFLFTDVEGSTRLVRELGPERYTEVLAEHHRALRQAFARHGGDEVQTQGDAFFVTFESAAAAVSAAHDGQLELAGGPIKVRMGLHTGEAHLTDVGHVGEDVHLAARIGAAGHGGQVLLSEATRRLVDAELLDLGEHRLKDFDEPVWLFQLGTEAFPQLQTISSTNLPRPASSFVGREREVGEVVELVRGGTRLVTLTGPGGTGKTRVAIEAAAELVSEFTAGVYWVGLATIHDPALVVDEVAQALGAQDGLTERIGRRELLLLLDNFEQLVGAAPDLSALLTACPNLHVLVTSRALLGISGEVEYALPPLAEREAVELFCARSRLKPDDEIGQLCRRLDNLPLAVELAAARTSVLTPGQILARIGQRLDLLKGGRATDERQQTLRATIAWSVDLLSDDERELFARFALFSGGCTLDAAEEIVEADLDTPRRSSRRASSGSRTAASGCWRPSASSPASGLLSFRRPPRSADATRSTTCASPRPAVARTPAPCSTSWRPTTTTSVPPGTGSRPTARSTPSSNSRLRSSAWRIRTRTGASS